MFRSFSRIGSIPVALLLAGLFSPSLAQQPRLEGWKKVSKPMPDAPASQEDLEVAVEVRILSVSPDFVPHFRGEAGIDMEKGQPGTGCPVQAARKGPVFLKDSQLQRLLEAVQKDARTSIMQAPKLTLFSGQESAFRCGDEIPFVTGVDLTVQDGRLCATPKMEMVSCGVELRVRPVVSADRRFVRMSMRAVLQNVDQSIPEVPVQVQTKPVEGDPKAVPVTFRQSLQQPQVQTLKVDKTFVLADGCTALLDAGNRFNYGRNEYGPPVLSDIPFVNRLFKNVGYSREPEQVLLLVTPRIIVNQEEEVKPPAPRADAVKVSMKELMRHFQTAYKEGKREEAELWAQLAVHLYPDDGVAAAALHMSRLASRISYPPVVRCAAEERVFDCPTKECCPKVAALLAKYEAACAAGKPEEARQCAAQALALDPTCFRKSCPAPCGK
jgi:Flp pilus assembly secretin CpaC